MLKKYIHKQNCVYLGIIFFMLSLMLTGCIAPDISLYPPNVTVKHLPSNINIADEVCIVLPKDLRNTYDKKFIGHIYKLRLMSEKDLRQWVQSCIYVNLKTTGLNVSRTTSKRTVFNISTSILSLETGGPSLSTVGAQITLKVKIEENGKIFYENTFSSNNSSTYRSGLHAEFINVLKLAMDEVLSQMLPVVCAELQKQKTIMLARNSKEQKIEKYKKNIPHISSERQLGKVLPESKIEENSMTSKTSSLGVGISIYKNFGKYHALIIGNNKYSNLPILQSAETDAKVVANLLAKQYNFKTTLLLNAKEKDIARELGDFRKNLTHNDSLLIYYAGHGWLDKEGDLGYWLPVDAEKDNEANWVSNAYITSLVRAIKAKHVIVIADSCFAGKLTRGMKLKRTSPGYLNRIAEKKSRTVMTSGGVEPVIDSGGKGNHSVFASAFIDVLKENKGAIDANSIFVKIRRKVILNSDQTPEYSDIRKAGHDGGDFIFIRKEVVR